MNTSDFTRPVGELTAEVKRYLNLRIGLAGMVLNKRMAEFTSALISILLLAAIFSMIVLMLSFAFVFWYGKSVGSYHHGFLIISLIYLIIGFIVYRFKQHLLLDPIIKKLNEKHQLLDNDFGSGLPAAENLTMLNKQLEILDLQIKHSELMMQKQLDELGHVLSPSRVINSLIVSTLTSSTVVLRAVSLLLRLMKKK